MGSLTFNPLTPRKPIMWVVLLTAEPQPRLLQLPTIDGKLCTSQFDTLADISIDLKGKFTGNGPSVPGKELSASELTYNIWALNIASGETVHLNELLLE